MIIHRCEKVKLRSHVMLLWTCLTCILLATIYFVFTLLIYRHYQAQARDRIERGIATLEQRLKGEGDDLSQGFPAELITPELLDHIAHEQGCDIYFQADTALQVRSLTKGGQRLLFEQYAQEDLPVFSIGTEPWQARQVGDKNNIVYGARLPLKGQGHAVLLFAQSLDFVHQGIAVLGEALALVFFIVFLLFFPVAAFFVRSSVTRPVEQLIAAMNSFDAEEQPFLDEDVSTVEFSSLAFAFNRMVRVLRHHYQQVDVLSTAVEQSPIAIVITDLEGRIEYVNSRMEQLTGYSAEELKGRPTSIFQSGYTSHEKYDELWNTVTSGKIWKEELLNKKKDGSLSWEFVVVAPIFAEDATIIKFVATKEDITERKQSQELLRRYEQIISATVDLMAFLDRDLIFCAVNKAYLDAFQKTREEIVGHSVAALYGRDFFHQVMKEKLDRCLAGETVHYQTWYNFSPTRRCCLHVSCYPFYTVENEISGIVMSSHDITGLKINQELLRESEQRYRQTFETNMAVKLIIDPTDGSIIEANQAAASYYGYTVEELVALRITDINQLTHEEILAEMDRAKEIERLYFNFRHKLASGEVRDVEVYSGPLQSGDRTLLYSIIHDITDRKQAEEKLLQSNERLEMIVQGANLGTWDWNITTDQIVFNDRWAEILGYDPDELPGDVSTWIEHLHPDDKEQTLQALDDLFTGRTSLLMSEQRLRNKAGEWVWILGAGKVFERGPQGEAIRAVGIQLDINARKQAEQQLITAKEQAESANRAKSVFWANITHELRTPLNAVLGYAQLLSAESSLTPKQLNNVQIIKSSGEYLLMLINDILDLSKIEAEKVELVSRVFRLPDFFSGIVDIFKAEADVKEVSLRYREDPQQPLFIQTDELRLRQVILNLLSNAVKFTSNGGHCSLQTEVTRQADAEAFLTVIVEDDGLGILPEMQEKIFEPFRQSGERLQYSEGSGLGLAISRRLVRLMGGDLQVLSPLYQDHQPGQGAGSRFFFTIPIEIIEQGKVPQETQHVITGYTVLEGERPKKILLLSTSSSNQIILENILTPLGFQVNEVVGKEALVEAGEKERADIILAVLPVIECEEMALLQQIKEQKSLQELPVIMLADASIFSALEEKQLEHLFIDRVVKPFSSFDLLSVLARHLGISLLYDNGEGPEVAPQIIPPPAEELSVLLMKVQQGDVAGMNQQISSLFSLEAGKYAEFARRVERLAEDFQLNMIADLIKRYGSSQ
ncbi:MAG: PAS domain S-box protein [Candidatus Electrothrix aestuarii]|uniref:histidine kinase n=1 Tax=Candidatus Electrothrix aestuarii TaxID=3062594 RepID=A0AAU8LQK2_9BACT|nr:PAS domain S-box protein [Candidatus Electrothrix aestuarii]